ncbi:MAG: LytTR family DNA-binding domain-containing protein [Bacteroidota bacterium]
MNALLIDDEKHCRESLRKLLKDDFGWINILEDATTADTGIRLIKKHKPDLVFLDVEMPEGNGFKVLRETTGYKYQVIFTTGFEKYALTAIQFGALYYLLKPIDKEQLEVALDKAREHISHKNTEGQYQVLLNAFNALVQKSLPKKFAISTSEGKHFRLVENIIRFKGERNYTKIFLENSREEFLSSTSLGDYEDQFDLYPEFVRVHKSHIVNLNFVMTYVRSDGGYLILKNGKKIPVSRLYRDDLGSGLDKL